MTGPDYRTLACTVVGVTLAGALLAPAPAEAGEPEETWLHALQADVRADIAAGKPVVVQVHVPLCDNSIIRCGGTGLGDGNNLKRNLYWATGEGRDFAAIRTGGVDGYARGQHRPAEKVRGGFTNPSDRRW